MSAAQELYYLERQTGAAVYDVNNVHIGYHSGLAGIAHDGKSVGKIYITDSPGSKRNGKWISGKALALNNSIKLVEDYIVWP